MLDPKRKIWRWGPISSCPLFMYYTVESSFVPLKNLLGVCYSETLVIFKDGKVTWLVDDEELTEAGGQFVSKVIDDLEKRKRYFDLWDERTRSLEEQFRKLDGLDLGELSNHELDNGFQEFSKVYFDWWSLTMSVELETLSLEPMLGQKLKPHYPQEHPKDLNRAFAILSSPKVLTFYREEQQDLLEIIDLPKEQQQKALQEHQRKYYWIYNSYAAAKILDVNYFKEEMDKLSEVDYKEVVSKLYFF